MCREAHLDSYQTAARGWPLLLLLLFFPFSNLWKGKARSPGSKHMQGRSGCFHDGDGFWKKRRGDSLP